MQDGPLLEHLPEALGQEENLKPHRSGTFKLSKDPAFAEKVADVIGLCLDPPGGAVVLSIDDKTQMQALDRTQPVLPVAFAATGKQGLIKFRRCPGCW